MKRFFMLFAVVLVAGSLWLSLASPFAQNITVQAPVVGLWIGTKTSGSSVELESIYAARYDPRDRSMDLLSVPIQTKVDVPFAPKPKPAGVFFKLKYADGGRNLNFASEQLKEWMQWFLFSSAGSLPEISYYAQMDSALLDELIQNPETFFKSFEINRNALHSSLNSFERELLFWELKEVKKEKIYTIYLPGEPGRDFWVSEPKNLSLTTQLFLTRGNTRKTAFNASKATVEVWNASSKKAIALDVARNLRKAGFDVVQWGNHPSKRERTLVRDRKGKYNQVQTILSLLPPGSEVLTQIDSRAAVDIEVVLGSDVQAFEFK